MRLLLDKGGDVNTQGGFYGNALRAAFRMDHREAAQLLLDDGADTKAVDVFGRSVFYTQLRDIQLAFTLERLDATDSKAMFQNQDLLGCYVVHHAARGSSAGLMYGAFAHGLEFDALDRQHWTPLHWSAYSGNADGIRLLISNLLVRTSTFLTSMAGHLTTLHSLPVMTKQLDYYHLPNQLTIAEFRLQRQMNCAASAIVVDM